MLGRCFLLKNDGYGNVIPKKVLVMGSNGYLGSLLVRKLITEGVAVVQLSKSKTAVVSNVEYFSVDLQSPERLAEIMMGCTHVVYAISTSVPTTAESNLLNEFDASIVPLINTLEACVLAKIDKFIFLSSGGAVYGNHDSYPLSEQSHPNPESSYGLGKLLMESYINYYGVKYNLNYNILRLTNPYGAYQALLGHKKQGLIGAVISRLVKGEEIVVWGSGDEVRDYIYETDAVLGIYKSIFYDGNERVFNISSGSGFTTKEVVHLIAKRLNIEPRINFNNKKQPDIKINILDNKLARKELDLKGAVVLNDGLSIAVQEYLDCVDAQK
jgi:UDP-glucose 4-epimerase